MQNIILEVNFKILSKICKFLIKFYQNLYPPLIIIIITCMYLVINSYYYLVWYSVSLRAFLHCNVFSINTLKHKQKILYQYIFREFSLCWIKYYEKRGEKGEREREKGEKKRKKGENSMNYKWFIIKYCNIFNY